MTTRHRVQYEFDLDVAERAIGTFNHSVCMQASEHLIDQAFGDFKQVLSGNGVHARVVLLDGLWATQLFRERGSSDRIAESLATNSGMLIELMETLHTKSLATQPGEVYAIAERALPIILNHTRGGEIVYRQNYSFATKFFHWCAREWLPIVDAKAREAINLKQREKNVRSCVRAGTAAMGGLTYLAEYERWIDFYSNTIDNLSKDDRIRLERVDHDSQRKAYRVKNTLLRILDKVFYIMGRESGLVRKGKRERESI